MVSQALLAHSAGCSEDQRCKCSMLNNNDDDDDDDDDDDNNKKKQVQIDD